MLRVSRLPRTTALGRRATLLGVGLLFAGFNTGNNLFHLLFALLASAELVGFVVARRALGRADLKVSLPQRAVAGEPVRVRVELRNRGRRLALPAMSWRVSMEGGERAEVRTPAVPPGESRLGTGRFSPSRRGPLGAARVEARTDFPLGLAGAVCRARLDGPQMLVHPRPLAGETAADPLPWRQGEDVRPAPGREGEPDDPREYRDGDDARLIDWKATARSGRVVVRERSAAEAARVVVLLDTRGAPGEAFERRVSQAAGAALAALDRGVAVGLTTPGPCLPPRPGPVQRRRILDLLAVVEADGQRPADGREAPRDAEPRVVRGGLSRDTAGRGTVGAPRRREKVGA